MATPQKRNAEDRLELEGNARKKKKNVDRIVPEKSFQEPSVDVAISDIPKDLDRNRPSYGDPVDRSKLSTAGKYILGPVIESSPIECLQQRLARKAGTNEFFILKILTIDEEKKAEDESRNIHQGKALLHTENFLLSLVRDLDGVIHAHEFFTDYVFEEELGTQPDTKSLVRIYTGRLLKRVVLVLDCVYPHEFDRRRSSAFVNLQQYVVRFKLNEWELLAIFKKIVEVVEKLHNRNIIHRDLKLNNVMLNRVTNKVVLTNFCLGKLLTSESSVFYEKRGTPAYIAPELLSGKAYKGKPCDMWACGIMLYRLVVGQFPFMDSAQLALFKKIKHAEFSFPADKKISTETKVLIESLLCLDPDKRYSAVDTLEHLKTILQMRNRRHTDQIVPDVDLESSSDKTKTRPGPSYELSHEQFSRTLELLTTQPSRDKNFIRPNILSLQRVRSAPNGSDSGNVVFNLPDGRRTSLTHQIDNLSIHANPDPSAWHTRLASGSSLAVQSLFLAINELFTRGRLPAPRETSREFNGYISHDISNKISNFLRMNCRSQELVRDIFNSGRSDRSKVIELFRRFGVQMEVTNNHVSVKTEQTINNLMFLTFMMQIAGYNNNYFLNIRN